ncbi:MAG: hypothetical protein AMJ65_17295 [Phycisphaerae bacterium SG8_4]|nr:MAG: hypothetical protein AMJ65_17295 [Phycisphaerae bacterium SG8_4]
MNDKYEEGIAFGEPLLISSPPNRSQIEVKLESGFGGWADEKVKIRLRWTKRLRSASTWAGKWPRCCRSWSEKLLQLVADLHDGRQSHSKTKANPERKRQGKVGFLGRQLRSQSPKKRSNLQQTLNIEQFLNDILVLFAPCERPRWPGEMETT